MAKLVLLDDVESLGLAGDEVEVSAGYARNFLIPKGKAMKASSGVMRQVAARKEKVEQRRQDELQRAKDLAAKFEGVDVTITMQASDDDQLYGSVNERMIAEAFNAASVPVDHHQVILPEPIKTLGMFTVEIKLHAQVRVDAKVWVVRT